MGNGSGEAEKIDSEVGVIDLLKGEGVNFAAALPKKFFLNFCKNNFSRGNFMQKINCVHPQRLKMLP